MLREAKCVQRLVRMIPFRIDGSDVAGGTGTTDGILEGTFHGTITENGSGDYTITFNTPFARTPVVILTAITDVTTVRLKAVSTTSFTVEQVGADQDTPSADGDFHALVVGFDAVDQN